LDYYGPFYKGIKYVGIGVQGLADVFFMLKIPFDSEQARDINTKIFATVYHAALETSCDIVDERKTAQHLGLLDPEETPWYSSFPGSPISQGLLQPDLWNVTPHPMYDWDVLRQRVKEGVRNSLLVAPMPTASTGQLLGNTEAFEPITSNLYSRTTLAGTFTVVNKHLLKDLIEMQLWSKELKNQIIAAEGSVQQLDIPQRLKEIYKTAYEISMKSVLNLAAERAPYIDQSMSLNMFMAEPTIRKLTSMHFYAWKKGLKTGMYYLRSKAASTATKITVEHLAGNTISNQQTYNNNNDDDVCVSCSG
jgi:ribonucleotide reductase alpha subunit